MFDTLPLTVFTSPRTGTEYLVVTETCTRMAGGVLEGCDMYRTEYTQYNIVLNGRPVQFCFSEGDIPNAVAAFENPGPDVSSPWD